MPRVAAFLLLGCLAAPLLIVLAWTTAARWPWPHLLPVAWSSRAWRASFDEGNPFAAPLVASLLVAGATTVLSGAVALPVASALARASGPRKATIETLLMAPLLTPAFRAAMGLHEWLLSFDAVEGFAPLVAAHLVLTFPYMERTLQASLEAEGVRLETQARSLGASPARAFARVTLPLLVPAFLTGGAFVFLGSMGEYAVSSLVGGGGWITLPLAVFPYVVAGDRPMGAVGSLWLVVPSVALFASVEACASRIRRSRKGADA